MNEEAGFWHNCAMAQAAKASHGLTIAVVRKRVGAGEIHPRDVRVPGCFVDLIVVDPDQGQTYPNRLRRHVHRRHPETGGAIQRVSV